MGCFSSKTSAEKKAMHERMRIKGSHDEHHIKVKQTEKAS